MEHNSMVSIFSSEMIQPAAAIEAAKFELTAFDRSMRYVPYQKRMLFFQSCGDDGASSMIANLKRSLSEALVVFYPVAGRIRSTGRNLEKLELDCSKELGVRFTVAEASMKLVDLPERFQPSKTCDSLAGENSLAHPWKLDHPLLFIQVTRFQCGGLCMGIAFSHQAMDGASAWRFMACWAKLARSGLDRSSLAPEDIPGPFYSYKDPQALAMTRDELLQAGADAGFVPLEASAPEISLESSLTTKVFTLDPAAVQRLKIEAGIAADGKRFTTYEVVCADFWKKMTIARVLPPGSTTSFILLVSGRGKIDSMPDSYFGNAVIHFLVSATAQEIKHEPLSHAAGLIHRGIAAATRGIHKSIAFLDQEIGNLFRYRISPFQLVVSSPRHPVMDCDFGFGRPVASSFGTNDLHEGKIYLFPSPSVDGGIDVTAVLRPDAIERLDIAEPI